MGNQMVRVNVPMIRVVGIIKDHGEMGEKSLFYFLLF